MGSFQSGRKLIGRRHHRYSAFGRCFLCN